jgi:hypothetical protein
MMARRLQACLWHPLRQRRCPRIFVFSCNATAVVAAGGRELQTRARSSRTLTGCAGPTAGHAIFDKHLPLLLVIY